MHLYLAVDLGTSFIKTGAYTLDGSCLGTWSQPVLDERPAPGMFIQRGEMLYQAVCACIKHTVAGLGERAVDVTSIALTGQMAGSIGVDENWNDVTTWSCTLDSRYLPYADEQRAKYGADMFEIGATNAPVMCSKMAWFRNEFPAEHRRIAKYVMLNGYMIGKMSKASVDDAMIDYSLITWTGMADTRNRAWSERICNEIGMDMKLLPKIVSCTTVGGSLDASVAKELGLKSGIPLVVGAGDKVSGCTGAGALDEGDMIFEAASYGAISCKVNEVKLDLDKRNYDVIGSIDDSSYYAHKYIQGSGITIDWFVNEFMRQEGEDAKQAFKRAERLAASVPAGSEKMMALGLLGGSAMPFNSDMKGLFIGHTWTHHKGHFYKALLESFSYDLALTMNSLMKQYPAYRDNPVRLIGGGAKSSLWPQMLADVTGHVFRTLSRDDIALWGAALLGAAGVGDVTDVAGEAKKRIAFKDTYTPDAKMHEFYKPYIANYEALTLGLNDCYRSLARL